MSEVSGIPAPRPDTRPKRLDTLTGLRFFAALAVVLCHVGATFSHDQLLITLTGYGYAGVSFFFVLSGFVLTWSAAHRTGPQPTARRFLWLRFARVWPAQFVLAVLAFTALATQELLPGTLGRVTEALLLQAWSPDSRVYFGGNGVSWSLSCEMFFYLLFPFVLPHLARLRARGLAVTAAATLGVLAATPLLANALGASAGLSYWLFFIFPPYRFGEFLLGMVLARAVYLGLRVPRPRPALLSAAAGLAVLGGALTWWTVAGGDAVPRPYTALLALPLFGLLLLGGATADLRRQPVWRAQGPTVKLGDWSFALYLVHKPLFLVTLAAGWWSTSGGVSGAADFMAFLLLAILLAAGLHLVVEQPVERWLRRWPIGTARPSTASLRSTSVM